MTKPTGMEEQRSRLDTARILSLPPHLLHSTVIGLVNIFLIHDATDLRWNARTRISGNKSQRHGVAFFFIFLRPSREGCLVSGEISPCSTVSDFMSQEWRILK